MRVFVDANILFSAAWREQNGLLKLWENNAFHLVTSPYAWQEAERNISLKKPIAMARLQKLLEPIEISQTIEALKNNHHLPAKDQPILAAAIAAKCMVLLTGDITHFGHLFNTTVEGVQIMLAGSFLAKYS